MRCGDTSMKIDPVKIMKVMGSISKLLTNIEIITKLHKFGTSIYLILKSRGIL